MLPIDGYHQRAQIYHAVCSTSDILCNSAAILQPNSPTLPTPPTSPTLPPSTISPTPYKHNRRTCSNCRHHKPNAQSSKSLHRHHDHPPPSSSRRPPQPPQQPHLTPNPASVVSADRLKQCHRHRHQHHCKHHHRHCQHRKSYTDIANTNNRRRTILIAATVDIIIRR